MKLRFIYILAFSIFATYVLQSKRLGLAAQLGLDRTGSPIAGGLNCGSCHSGAFNGVTLTLRVKDSGGTVVTSYVPGDTYTVEFDLASNSSFTRGFQGVALTSSNAQAGTFSSPQASTQISTIGSRQYVEHSTPALSAGTFIFIASWTAPAITTGNVTFYADGVVANGNNSTSGDDPAGPVSLVLTEEPSASIDYTQSSYCQGSADPTPTITGTSGGTFSSTGGLALNSTTGEIDLSASTPGTYTITYTSATGTTTDNVAVVATDDPSFSYPKSSYCLSEPDPNPTITGLAGGSFAVNPAGLVINASTGQIDVSASSIGTYSVGYITNGPCPTVGTFSFSITNTDDASFAYGNSVYCQSGTDPTPTPAISGGTFSSTSGLSINASSGLIDLSASTPGTYTVTHTTTGTCSSSSTETVGITAADNASFNYSTTSYCQNGTDPSPTITGLGGGTFSSTGGLSINSSTGQIDVSASTAGTYTVTYTTSGACPNSSTRSVTINSLDDAGFNYTTTSYCQNGTDPSPTITGVSGGTFSSTAGLSINSSTGQIDVSASTAGTYTVTYTTSGACPNSSTRSVTINSVSNAGFNYSTTSYCQNGTDPSPTITGVSGGTFSSTVGLSINSSTGQIDLSASTAGTYTVTYTTSGACPSSSTRSVTINSVSNAGFNYSTTSYCQNGTDPSPTITGVSGGTFSSTAGLSINSSTGQIDVSASTAGTYTVTYTTSGACSNSSTRSVTINSVSNAGFNYSTTSYCQNGTDPSPTITGVSGGTFSSTAGLSINSSTGQIDVSASTLGTYTITYATSGACPSSSTRSITINSLDNANFNYSTTAYCQNVSDPSPTITGLSGGTFSSTGGLSINSSTGQIDVSASTVGTYTVTYMTSGSCANSSTQSVTINSLDNAGFNYSTTSYCQNGTDPSPTITGSSGGTFSSTSGLSINSSTGQVDLSASTAGTYTVTYTTSGVCPNSSTRSITINSLDNASFNYSTTAYCQNGTDPSPTITGLSGGTFSSTGGLSINSSTGQIDVSASTAGAYTVTYTTSGACPNSSTRSITINSLDNAGFNYSTTSYCQNGTDPSPTITGLSGGTFNSAGGLSINNSTGQIDLSTSTAGTYTVTYVTTGACPNSSTRSITINSLDNAGFNYSISSYCQNGNDPTPTITGLSGGTFSSAAGLSINNSTGQIDVSTSSLGTYTVTYATSGACPNSSTQSITINNLDDASFNYSTTSYCQNGTDPSPTITGLSGGTFSSTAGLSINSNTGQIDVSASTLGTYTVTYMTSGSCANSSTQSVTISTLDNANFNYSTAAYCQNGNDPSPTITGLLGGTFSSTSGLSINSSTGQVDVSNSTVGIYTVTYLTSGSCPNSSTQFITISTSDDASFNYNTTSYCQNGNDPSPTITGLSGGTFTSTSGLSINSSTGQVDVSNSTLGTYTVTYTTSGACPNSSTQSITINTLDDASFNYSTATYCQNGNDPSPTITGLSGGTFSSTSGLSINSSTGQIDVSASNLGTYTVTYTTLGACSNSSTQSIVIGTLDDASFNYSTTSYCQNGSDPNPTITGLPGGTFSAGSGLSINSSTGQIDVSASNVGTYTITYMTSGACANSSTQSITISTLDNASFNYSSITYCQNASDPSPTLTGLSGGTYSSASGLAINSSTGQIDVSASNVGTYTVTYMTSGACANSSTQSITIIGGDDPSFSYSAATYCQNGSDPSPTLTGLGGGTFTSTSGLIINSSTGQIDVSASTVGIYNITYTTNGSCSSSSIETVNVQALDDATFTYGGSAFCQSAPDPSPTVGLTGGVFTAAPSGLVINPSTGQIDVSASTTGTYNLTYSTNGFCPSSTSISVNITATGNASFAYSSVEYCQNVANPSPVVTGNPGGTFSSTGGLAINSTTGTIDLLASAIGTYTVTYNITGACASSSSVIVKVLVSDLADFGYTDTTICLNIGVNPTLSVTGASSGIYTSNSSGMVLANAVTGEVDLAASVPGNYILSYTSNGNCPATVSLNVDLSICGGVQSIATEALYTLFPNPNKGRFSIENRGEAGDLMIRVRDIYGKVIYLEETYLNNQEQYGIEVPGIVKGMYLIEIQKGASLKVLKMIVSE